MAEQAISAECTTVIGGDATIKGEVSVEKGLRVDGRVEGSVNTPGKILVGKSGELKAEVQAGLVSIEGTVKGNVTASESVKIEASGRIFGDLTAPKLNMAEGCTFVGKLNVGSDAKKDESSSLEDSLPESLASRMNTLAVTTVGAEDDE